MSANVFGIGRWNRFIDFLLRHPVYSHCVTDRSYRTVTAASDLDKILPFTSLPIVVFPLVKCVHLGMFSMGYVVRLRHAEIRFEQPVADHSQARKHRSAQNYRVK